MISVVIPLYNKAHTIVNTLKTVLNQTYQDFEVIIVNDGSTDNCIELIQQNFNNKKIKIIQQNNAGVSVARNRGITESNGDWISFLDADDEWLPTYLEEVHHATKLFKEAGIIITGRFSQNYTTHKRSYNIPSKVLNKTSEIKFFENPHVYAHISATTIKSSILKNEEYTWNRFIAGQKSNEDFTFLYRIALHAKTIYIGKPLIIYNGSIPNQATSILKINEKIHDYILFNNAVIQEYLNSKNKNHEFIIFMKYTFRHTILQLLKTKDYHNILLIINNLDKESLKLLIKRFEYKLYSKSNFNKLAIIYILTTKIIWRTHNYPRVK